MQRRTLLSSEQRTRLFGIPTEAAEVAKHYVLSAEDLALVQAKRRPNNRLGYAVQLCVLRHPGRPLEPSEVPPAAMLALLLTRWAPIRSCLATTRIEPRPVGSICSNCSRTCACAASAWRIGAPACTSAPTPPGRLTAASRSCRLCLRTCGPIGCSSRSRQCWSELGSRRERVLANECSRPSPRG